jgi:hypothetical protein
MSMPMPVVDPLMVLMVSTAGWLSFRCRVAQLLLNPGHALTLWWAHSLPHISLDSFAVTAYRS